MKSVSESRSFPSPRGMVQIAFPYGVMKSLWTINILNVVDRCLNKFGLKEFNPDPIDEQKKNPTKKKNNKKNNNKMTI